MKKTLANGDDHDDMDYIINNRHYLLTTAFTDHP